MNLIIKIDVHGTKALLTEMPKLPEGITEPIRLAVTFDESWADIVPKRAVLWREGDALLYLDLGTDKTAAVPTAFAETERPFYIRITGREDCSLSTNELCASFFNLHTTEAAEPRYRVFDSSQAIVKNGTYFCENALLTEAVTVAIPYNADTTEDTVTPETLHAGYTAHDASGKPIEGTYTNPYNADTTKDTVTPETLHAGYTAHDASGKPIEGTYTNPYNADTTEDTVTPETLHAGYTAHDASGKPIEGTYINPYNADTTEDTVTPEALHAGYTAHDASGKPIEGTYTNPYNADTTKDTVTPEALHAGYTAHDASGKPIEGTYTPSPAKTTSSTLSRVTNVFVSATPAPVTTIARE